MPDTEPRLTTPRVRVVMDNGTVHTVQILNIDMVEFDRQRGRHREWPSVEDGPMHYQTYVAWHALTRLNLIAKINFNEFCERALEVTQADEDGDVDPTPTAAVPG